MAGVHLYSLSNANTALEAGESGRKIRQLGCLDLSRADDKLKFSILDDHVLKVHGDFPSTCLGSGCFLAMTLPYGTFPRVEYLWDPGRRPCSNRGQEQRDPQLLSGAQLDPGSCMTEPISGSDLQTPGRQVGGGFGIVIIARTASTSTFLRVVRRPG